MMAAMSGVNRPATKASTTAAKVRPMTKATAIWTKLPCITNFLKLDTFQPPPGRTDRECEKAYLAGHPNPISFHNKKGSTALCVGERGDRHTAHRRGFLRSPHGE